MRVKILAAASRNFLDEIKNCRWYDSGTLSGKTLATLGHRIVLR